MFLNVVFASTVDENFPWKPLIKLSSLTNGNFEKTENTVNETKFRSYPLKLTATWDFIFKTVGTNGYWNGLKKLECARPYMGPMSLNPTSLTLSLNFNCKVEKQKLNQRINFKQSK